MNLLGIRCHIDLFEQARKLRKLRSATVFLFKDLGVFALYGISVDIIGPVVLNCVDEK